MGLAWEEHLSVGNGLIDSDHKNLIAVVNRVEDAIGSGDRADLSNSFELLDTYMRIHFINEEKIAHAVNYPFEENKLTHLQLMAEVQYMIQKLETTCGTWPDNLVRMYCRFLNGWMMEHIIKTDMPMKPTLLTYPYNFIPN